MRLKLGLVAAGLVFLLLTGMRPDAMPYPRYDARFSDAVTAHWPNALFFHESVQAGIFPLWRETTMAGQPFAANPLNKTAYPLQWLAVVFPPALHLNIMTVLHLLVAGIGMWYWVRSLGLGPEASLVSTAAYVFAPQMVGRLGVGHLDILYALAWWPWLMFTIKRSVDTDVNPLRQILQTGILSALLFTGDSRVGLYALLTGAVYEVFLLIRARQLWRANSRLLIVPIFLILTVAVLIPLILWQPYTNRIALTPAEAGVFSLEPIQFLGLVMPTYRGTIENLTYVGIGVLVLAVFGLFSRPRRERYLWLAVLVPTILYGMGSNSFLWPLLVRFFPALLWFRVPSRIWLVIMLLVAVLAGYGLDWFLTTLDTKLVIPKLKRINLLLAVYMLVMVVLSIFAIAILRLPAAVSVSMLIIGPALGAVLLAALNGRLNQRIVIILLAGLTVLDLFWTGYQLLDWRGEEFWLDPYRPLAEALVADGADRIYSPTYSLEQQVAEVYHLHLFGGVDPFQLSGVVDAVEKGSGVPDTQYSITVPPLNGVEDENDLAEANRDAIIDTVVLAKWHVSHVVSGHKLNNPRLQLLDTMNGVYVYRNLDDTTRTAAKLEPDWPADWPNLPEPQQVEQFNQITILAMIVSGVGWILAVGFFIYLTVKTRR